VAIARALAPDPEIIICDEITSALDVSVQAAVLTLLAQLRDELGLGILLITHDFGVVAAIADYLLVLERGAVVEQGTVSDVLREPRSEYTKSLLDAAPSASEALRRLNGRAHDE
jgi:peptide/nickel transport system ATP-binding protein